MSITVENKHFYQTVLSDFKSCLIQWIFLFLLPFVFLQLFHVQCVHKSGLFLIGSREEDSILSIDLKKKKKK